jgi:hypothetical protein
VSDFSEYWKYGVLVLTNGYHFRVCRETNHSPIALFWDKQEAIAFAIEVAEHDSQEGEGR